MNVYRFTAFAAVAASVLAMPISGAQAAARDKLTLVVPKGMCANAIQQLAAQSVYSPVFTVFAAPRVHNAKNLSCDQPGPEVTVSTSSSSSLDVATKAALKACNDARGIHGPCFVTGTLHK